MACSGAFILRCRDSGQEIRGCFTDNSTDSDNYRGELLRAPLALSSSSVLLSFHVTTPASLKTHPYQRFFYTVTTAGSFSTAMIHTVLSRMVRNKLI
jgi:hypothetical protein